jgi:hypothetical protein
MLCFYTLFILCVTFLPFSPSLSRIFFSIKSVQHGSKKLTACNKAHDAKIIIVFYYSSSLPPSHEMQATLLLSSHISRILVDGLTDGLILFPAGHTQISRDFHHLHRSQIKTYLLGILLPPLHIYFCVFLIICLWCLHLPRVCDSRKSSAESWG